MTTDRPIACLGWGLRLSLTTCAVILSVAPAAPATGGEPLAGSGPVVYQGPGPARARTVEVDLPAQPLAKSLRDLGRIAGFQFLADRALTQGRRAPAVKGGMTVDDALTRLLAGSGLSYSFDGKSTVALVGPSGGANGPLALGAITVTGERQARSLRQTTSSVTVLNEEDIRRNDPDHVFRTIQGTPNVLPFDGRELPSIRGSESGGPAGLIQGVFSNTQTRAALIVDDVPAISSLANNTFSTVFDVEQVEVFRGPQTTARGSNAIDGAFVVRTKNPKFIKEYELNLEPTWDEFSGVGFRSGVMVNHPVLDDQIAARLVVEYAEQQIPARVRDVDNDNAGALAGVDLDRLGEIDDLSIRNKWLFKPRALPNLTVLANLRFQHARNLADEGFVESEGESDRPIQDRLFDPENVDVYDTRSELGALNVAYELRPGVTLRSITGWQRDNAQAADTYVGPTELVRQITRRLNQDFLLELDGRDRRLTGVFGVAHEQVISNSELVGFSSTSNGERDSYSVFGDLTYRLTPALRVLGGFRLQRYLAGNQLRFNATRTDADIQETVFLPKLGVSYDITPDHTVSLTARRGYNPGGVALSFSNTPFEFDSETSETLELTYRAGFADGRHSIGATAFYNSFQDRLFRFNPDGAGGNTQVVNLDESRSFGLELEGRAHLGEKWRVDAGLGLLDTKITDVGNSTDPNTTKLQGNSFGQDPRVNASLGILWFATDALEFSLKGQYVGTYFKDLQNEFERDGGGYFLIDLGMGYSKGAMTARAFVRNVTDEFAVTKRFSGSHGVLPPRTVGASLNIQF